VGLAQAGQQRVVRVHVALSQYHGFLVEYDALAQVAKKLALHSKVVVCDSQCRNLIPEKGSC